MRKYATYPDSADSKVEWLGRIPTDWQALPIAALLEERGELNKGLRTENVLSVLRDIGVIPYEEKGDIGNKKSEDIERYKVVYPGDLVVNSMNVIIGSVGVSAYHGALSPVYLVLKPRHGKAIHKHYVGYAVQIKTFQQWLKRLGYGILEHRLRIPMDNLKREYLPVPPYADQERIVDFLDHETAKIDRLIARQERLIELLKEKRQAVISHAVTKGLDPDVPKKDSGVEWLGEVPVHWAVSRVGFVSRLIQTGPFGSQLHAEDYVEGGVPVINPANIQAGEIVPDDRVSVDAETAERLQRHQLEENEIIFARRGELGRCALVTSDTKGWICGTGSLKISLDAGKVEPAFVTRFLRITGVKEELSLSSKGSTMENLNAEILRKVSLVYPDIKEQQSILQYLSETEEKLERLYQRAGDAVTLLKEHRTALISAAVTGKIDVRNFKPANA